MCLDGAVLLALAAIVFYKLALTNLIIARGDVFTYFYPYFDYAAQATRQGHLPLWNPYLFMGAPFLANSQAGFFYPLNRLLSWLPVTRAVNVTIIVHVWLAGLGMYAFARRSLDVSRLAAWMASAAFAVGGYLAAQVEHVNQLQGLAWLPWLLVWFDLAWGRNPLPARRGIPGIGLAVTVALQLLTGHTQSAFISLMGLGLYALLSHPLQPCRAWLKRWAALAGAVMLGAALAAVQLVPTFELAQLSIRSGGLSWREAVSFSLKPALVGRALLPDYGQAIFPEYVAYVGVAGLMLAVIGLMGRWRDARIRVLAALAGLGLFFALGGYNPLYLALVRFAPGFGLFRVPARWLVWYAFGAAGLIGCGFDALAGSPRRLVLTVWGAAFMALAALAWYAARVIVPGTDQPAGNVSTMAWLGWLVAAGGVAGLVWLRPRWSAAALAAIVAVELFAASAALPFNRATAPEALTSLRPSILTLQSPGSDLSSPIFRFLSLSDIFFDPGDRAELDSAFADQLGADAFYDLLVATKQKEIVAPNLPLYYRLPTVDGFDGGILPLRDYVTFQQLFAPTEHISPDGRLREALRDVPDGKWLSLMNVRYVVTDKTLDAWLDDVFYDLQFSTALEAGRVERAVVARVPRFEATALGMVSYLQGAARAPQGAPAAQVMVGFDGGMTQTFTLRAGVDTAEGIYPGDAAHQAAQVGGHYVRDHPEITDYVTRLRWDSPRIVTSVRVQVETPGFSVIVRGASLIDERTGAFQSLVISGRGRFVQLYSGDVKIYENLDALPRAFVVPRALARRGNDALAAMRDPAFDPASQVILDMPDVPQVAAANDYTATLTLYQPEHVLVEVATDQLAWLVLTDTYYPGWRAFIDGKPAPITRADMLFRAVAVPQGKHCVEFVYDPLSLKIGAGVSLAALIVAVVCLVLIQRRRFVGWAG